MSYFSLWKKFLFKAEMYSKTNWYVIVFSGWGEVGCQVKPILEPIEHIYFFNSQSFSFFSSLALKAVPVCKC